MNTKEIKRTTKLAKVVDSSEGQHRRLSKKQPTTKKTTPRLDTKALGAAITNMSLDTKKTVANDDAHETLSYNDIMTNYKDTPVYKMLKKGTMQRDSESIFILKFDKKYDLPSQKEFQITDIKGFKDIGIAYVEGNRLLKKSYIKKLMGSMEKHVHQSTCLMDVDGNIYDGQSRIAAAMALGKHVFVIVAAHPTKRMVIDLNANCKSWTCEDKVRAYMAEGNENYKRLYILMHQFDEEVKYKHILSAVNLSRNSVYNMAVGTFWAGGVLKDIIDNGDLILTEEMYQKICKFMKTYYADCAIHLEQCKDACLERLAKKGLTPKSKVYVRQEFLQISLFKMLDLRNKAGERIGDNEKMFKEFLSCLDIEAEVSNNMAYGLHLAGVNSMAQKNCKDLFIELLHLFDRWNETFYSPKHHITYDAATMSIYDAFINSQKA